MDINIPTHEEIEEAKLHAEKIGCKEIDGIDCMVCLKLMPARYQWYCKEHQKKPEKVPCSKFCSALGIKIGDETTEGEK